MWVTVILCTYNRSKDLLKALNGVLASRFDDPVDWEVLVVDNNSHDDTSEVVNEFKRQSPERIRYLFEPQPGKSNALNAGIREASGEIIAFMDDDVVVDPRWLQNLINPLSKAQWSGVGGRILPIQEIPLPGWMTLHGPYSQAGVVAAGFDLGDRPHELEVAPYGANMAYRKSVFKRYGGFRVDLGPSPDPNIPRHTEDTEFGRRVLAGGGRIVYEPSAIVRHPVSADRVKKRYILKWWFDFGRAECRVVGRKSNILGIPRYLISIPLMTVTMLLPTAVRWLVTLNKPKRFFLRCWMWSIIGQMLETHRQRHNVVGK